MQVFRRTVNVSSVLFQVTAYELPPSDTSLGVAPILKFVAYDPKGHTQVGTKMNAVKAMAGGVLFGSAGFLFMVYGRTCYILCHMSLILFVFFILKPFFVRCLLFFFVCVCVCGGYIFVIFPVGFCPRVVISAEACNHGTCISPRGNNQ